MGGESPRQITTRAGNDFSPSWSPDNSELVFVRYSRGACHIMRINIENVNSSPEKILECTPSEMPNEVIWGNNDNIYFTDSFSDVDPYKIYKYSLKTSKKDQLTNPVNGKSKGDIHIALSNDEKYLAFTRDKNWSSTQVILLNLETNELTNLFDLSGWRKALAWSFDNQTLYYIDEEDNINAYSIEYDFHKKVLDNSETLHSISGHRTEDKLTIMTGETGIDIWGKHTGDNDQETAFIESSEIDLYPEFAHNSNDIAFVSLRSGQAQIWIKSSNGREYQLSLFNDNRVIQHIRWSPNDQFLLASTGTELYSIDIKTKEYTTIWQTKPNVRIEAANWSPDGNTVYFSSDIDGDWQIYKLALDTASKPIRITDKGGYSPELTKEAEMLYYKYHQDGIWKMQLDTKSESKLIDDSNVFAYDGLYAKNNGFFYIS